MTTVGRVGGRGSVVVGGRGSAVVCSLDDKGKIRKSFLMGDRGCVSRKGSVIVGSSVTVKCFGKGKLSKNALMGDRSLTGEVG